MAWHSFITDPIKQGREQRSVIEAAREEARNAGSGAASDLVSAARKEQAEALRNAAIKSETDLIKRETRDMTKAIRKPGFLHRVGRDGFGTALKDSVKKNGKLAAIGLGAAALIGGAAYVLRSKAKERTAADIADASLMAPPVAMDPMVGAPTMMGMQPTPGDFAARVDAGRGVGGPALRAQ